MHDVNTLYKLAVQMHILHQEELGQAPPTIEEAKKAVEHLLASMNGQVTSNRFIISSDETETEEIQLKKQGNNLNFAYLLKDTQTGIICDKKAFNVPFNAFVPIAETILNMAWSK